MVLDETISYQMQVRMDIYEFYEAYTAWQPVLDARRKAADKSKKQ